MKLMVLSCALFAVGLCEDFRLLYDYSGSRDFDGSVAKIELTSPVHFFRQKLTTLYVSFFAKLPISMYVSYSLRIIADWEMFISYASGWNRWEIGLVNHSLLISWKTLHFTRKKPKIFYKTFLVSQNCN